MLLHYKNQDRRKKNLLKRRKTNKRTFGPFPERLAPLLLTVSEDIEEETSSLASSVVVGVVVVTGVDDVVVVEVLTLSGFCPYVSRAAP